MATASEEENLTRNAQALYVIPLQALGLSWGWLAGMKRYVRNAYLLELDCKDR